MLYAYSVKEPIGELNLKRALDEDTGVFFSFFSLLSSSSPLGQTAVSGNSTFISDPGSLCLFFILIFCESLALYAKSRGLIYTIVHCNVQYINYYCSYIITVYTLYSIFS